MSLVCFFLAEKRHEKKNCSKNQKMSFHGQPLNHSAVKSTLKINLKKSCTTSFIE
jgi:hypothetical protein